MATLKEKAEKFATSCQGKTEKEILAKWEHLSNWVNSGRVNSGKGYSPYTIARFTTQVRGALTRAGIDSKIVSQIYSADGLRDTVRENSRQALHKFTSGEVEMKISKPKKLIAEAVEICENSVFAGELIAALGILIGRRASKIVQLCATNDYSVIDDKHIEVYNLPKGGLEQVIIPVLGGIEAVLTGLDALSELLGDDVGEMPLEKIKSRYQSNASKSAKKLLGDYVTGDKLTMHTTRKVYTAVCIASVHGKSKYTPVSMSGFITHVLGHRSKGADENYDYIQIDGKYDW